MFLYEAKQILRKFLLLRPGSLDNSKKVFSRCNFSDKCCASAQLDTFQRAVCIFYYSLPLTSSSSLLKVLLSAMICDTIEIFLIRSQKTNHTSI